MKKTILFALILTIFTNVTWAGSTQELFIIERSKNTNVLHYAAQISNDGKLHTDEPLVAYWVLLAEDGRKQELTWLEKEIAYGFDINKDSSGKFYLMTLMSYKQREIKVYQKGDRIIAEIIIDGKPSHFERVYINFDDGWLLPKVNYIELYGKDIETGERRYEKIIP